MLTHYASTHTHTSIFLLYIYYEKMKPLYCCLNIVIIYI